MTDLKEYAYHYIKQLAGPEADNAWHSLVEADHAIIPFLVEAFRIEPATKTRSLLVSVIWQHRLPETLDFLTEALDDRAPEVWKSALDGLVTLGEPSAIRVLQSAKEHIQGGGEMAAAKVEWIDEAIRQTAERR